MPSALFTVNGLDAVPPTPVLSSPVTLTLVSTSGVTSVAWTQLGKSSSSLANAVFTPSGSPSGASCSMTISLGTATTGSAYLIQCKINGGVDQSGQPVAEYTKTAIVGVLRNSGSGTGIPAAFALPFPTGETLERDASNGWAPVLNQMTSGTFGSATLSTEGQVQYGSLALVATSEGNTSTSGATPTNAWSYVPSSAGRYMVDATVTASLGDGTSGLYRRSAAFKRVGATVSQVAATTGSDYEEAGIAAADATITLSGTNTIVVRVTGIAATNITWAVGANVMKTA